MGDEKPFAWCRQVGEEVCIEADDGFVVARFALDVSSQSEYTKDALSSAVAARERKAAAKALRAAAEYFAGKMDSLPAVDANADALKGADDALRAVVETLRSRADNLERGDA